LKKIKKIMDKYILSFFDFIKINENLFNTNIEWILPDEIYFKQDINEMIGNKDG